MKQHSEGQSTLSPPPKQSGYPQGWRWVMGHWLGSRAIILGMMLGVAPLLQPVTETVPTLDWRSLVQWDSKFYEQIATQGYEYLADGLGHNVAFFPLFPLLMSLGGQLGIPAGLAGILVNNLTFGAGLWVVYDWARQRHGTGVARWATAALAWCPWSLFGTVPYTEGTFILTSALALRAFDQGRSLRAGLWGALASATRLPGAMLMPAFLWVAWREKGGVRRYVGGLLAGLGVASYGAFCAWRFGDGLVFLKVQKAWRPLELTFFGEGWLKSLVQVFLGPAAWKAGRIVEPLYLVEVGAIALIAVLIWRFRRSLGAQGLVYAYCGWGVLCWIVAGSPLLNLTMAIGGAVLLWVMRRELAPVALAQGALTVLLMVATGRTISVERFMFALVPVAIAFGLLLDRYPRWGRPVLCCWALPLASLSLRFVQVLWAG
jgi:Gpi18-like mannosyltransferase